MAAEITNFEFKSIDIARGIDYIKSDTLRIREPVANLDPNELKAFRKALAAMKQLGDERGFAYHAGIHGLPLPFWCQHNSQLFPSWHRAYLYAFELALQDAYRSLPDSDKVEGIEAEKIALPWWDWSSDRYQGEGDIPDAYKEEMADGQPNPLYNSHLLVLDLATGNPLIDPDYGDAMNRPTRRYPGLNQQRALPTRQDVCNLLNFRTWDDFAPALEDIHNRVHAWVGGENDREPEFKLFEIDAKFQTELDNGQISSELQQKFASEGYPLNEPAVVVVQNNGRTVKWVIQTKDSRGRLRPTFAIWPGSPNLDVYRSIRGDMGRLNTAAFDPIFWAHHCTIDRLYWLWQLRHKNFGIERDVQETTIAPFPFHAGEMNDIHNLGYEYAAKTVRIV